MLYRLATIGIIAFWMVMMGLLLRLETHPEATDILDVPVSYVMRIMFKHGQQSLLTVSEEEKPIGTVSLRPATTGSNARSLDFSGTVALQLPLATPQRFNFNGAVDMDAALRVLDFHVDLAVQVPRFRLSVKGDMARKILSYETHQGGQLIASQTLPMEAAALGPALSQNLGLDPNALPMLSGNVSPPGITAREAQINLHGEQLQVYDVAVREGTVTIADIYVTQLGQIVMAKTNFGYTLAAEDFQ